MDATESKPNARTFRATFSLRTLLLTVLLIGSATTLWWRWEPWVVVFQTTTSASIRAADLTPDGRFLVISTLPRNLDEMKKYGETQNVQIWDVQNGRKLHEKSFPHARLGSVRIKTSQWVQVHSNMSRSHLMNIQTGEIVRDSEGNNALVFDVWPDASKALSNRYVGEDSNPIIEIPSGKILGRVELNYEVNLDTKASSGIAISIDGHRLLNYGWDGMMLFDVDRMRPIIETKDSADFAWFAPDSSKFFVESHNQGPTLEFDATTGAKLGPSTRADLHSHATGYPFVETSPRMIEQNGIRQELWICNAVTKERLYAIRNHDDGEVYGGFTVDGRKLVTNDLHTVCLWENRRSESHWGLLALPEFWLTLIFAVAGTMSFISDRKIQRG